MKPMLGAGAEFRLIGIKAIADPASMLRPQRRAWRPAVSAPLESPGLAAHSAANATPDRRPRPRDLQASGAAVAGRVERWSSRPHVGSEVTKRCRAPDRPSSLALRANSDIHCASRTPYRLPLRTMTPPWVGRRR